MSVCPHVEQLFPLPKVLWLQNLSETKKRSCQGSLESSSRGWLVINPRQGYVASLRLFLVGNHFKKMKSHLSANFRMEWGSSTPRVFVGPKPSPFLSLKVSLPSQQTINTLPTDTKDPSDFDLGSIAARRGVHQFDDFGSSDLWKWSKWSATVVGRVESLNMIKWSGLRIFQL